jgi:hypothetical protein
MILNCGKLNFGELEMSVNDWWAYRMIKRFERNLDRERERGFGPWPGYWSVCILNYYDHLQIVWC